MSASLGRHAAPWVAEGTSGQRAALRERSMEAEVRETRVDTYKWKISDHAKSFPVRTGRLAVGLPVSFDVESDPQDRKPAKVVQPVPLRTQARLERSGAARALTRLKDLYEGDMK